MTSLAADPRDWTADQLMTLIAEAIKARDLEAVPHLITLLAFKDAHRAETVLDGITLMLDVRRGSAAREEAADAR